MRFFKTGYRILIIPYSIILLYLMTYGFGRKQSDEFSFNLIPLKTISYFFYNLFANGDYKNFAINIFGNIILFVPFGFINWKFPRFNNFKKIAVIFIPVIFLIEIFQYFSRMGMFDFDDVFLNTLGMLIGFIIFKKKRDGKFDVK